jgi:hypothetical protein
MRADFALPIYAASHELYAEESGGDSAPSSPSSKHFWSLPDDIDVTFRERHAKHPRPDDFVRALAIPKSTALSYLRRWVAWKLVNGLILEGPLCILDVILLVQGFNLATNLREARARLVVLTVGAAVRGLGVLVHGISTGMLVRQLQDLTKAQSVADVLRDIIPALRAIWEDKSD